jgi:hypothetical protein
MEMLMMIASPLDFRAANAARLMLNVPRASISITVRKPLELSCSAGDRKLPAAGRQAVGGRVSQGRDKER